MVAIKVVVEKVVMVAISPLASVVLGELYKRDGSRELDRLQNYGRQYAIRRHCRRLRRWA
jgi:hypothetical protein